VDPYRSEREFLAEAYAPPQSEIVANARDFREQAEEFSLRLVRESFGRPITELGHSLCLPVENPANLTSIKWWMLLHLLGGIGGLVAGGVLAGTSQYLQKASAALEPVAFVLAAACSLGGFGLLMTASRVARNFARRGIGERYDAVWAIGSPIKPKGVSVEDASTFEKFKLVPEDAAWIGFDVARRMLLIEGIRFRYVIRASDLVNLEQLAAPTATATAITYRVGPAVLRIALQYDSLRHELRKQLLGARHDALMKPITETLVEQASLA
jgi:hypothetical protein